MRQQGGLPGPPCHGQPAGECHRVFLSFFVIDTGDGHSDRVFPAGILVCCSVNFETRAYLNLKRKALPTRIPAASRSVVMWGPCAGAALDPPVMDSSY